jgi:hypothetical protein
LVNASLAVTPQGPNTHSNASQASGEDCRAQAYDGSGIKRVHREAQVEIKQCGYERQHDTQPKHSTAAYGLCGRLDFSRALAQVSEQDQANQGKDNACGS